MERSTPFSATTVVEAARVTVTVGGDLDFATHGKLAAEFDKLMDLSPDGVVVDLTGVEFCDSSGLSCLVRLNARCVDARVPLLILPSPRISRLVAMTGLTGILPVGGA
ncbi:STAS domain-containing protein [Amycolatopsis lurida]|uniref:STAS domain-containing protein n=1 Tax=Amycolatopsis lurida TaxID=31959 RepID=UPI003664C78D